MPKACLQAICHIRPTRPTRPTHCLRHHARQTEWQTQWSKPLQCAAARSDIGRLGADMFRASPRQAGWVFVAGTLCNKRALMRKGDDQMTGLRWVIAMGPCAHGTSTPHESALFAARAALACSPKANP